MPRVMPSQVVAFIDQVFSWAATQEEGQGVNLVVGNSRLLTALLDLTAEIPGELLTMDGPNYRNYVCSLATIRDQIEFWKAHQPSVGEIVFIPGLPQLSPVTLVRRALSACPDESPAPATTELNFIGDAALKEGLQLDIGATNRALCNGEWKAATVLAGSVIEALLLWTLQQRPRAAVAASQTLVGNGTLSRAPAEALERWSLHEYIEVARALEIITAQTATETRLAKDFRNLIHPGRTQRLGRPHILTKKPLANFRESGP